MQVTLQEELRILLMRGTVKWFSNTKGYGFIVPEGGGKDIFVHHAHIQMDGYRTLKQDEKVEFDLDQDATGRRQAVKVSRIDSRAPARARKGPKASS